LGTRRWPPWRDAAAAIFIPYDDELGVHPTSALIVPSSGIGSGECRQRSADAVALGNV
jgi:hypothetical protein